MSALTTIGAQNLPANIGTNNPDKIRYEYYRDPLIARGIQGRRVRFPAGEHRQALGHRL